MTNEERSIPSAWLALVLALVALPYLGGLSGEFVYDDHLVVVQNPAVTGDAGWAAAWTRPFIAFSEGDLAQRSPGYWRPLTTTLHHLAWRIGGGDPLPFHLLGLALHLAATAIAFALARCFLGPVWSLLAAAWFGLRPNAVEPVVWISSLGDPLFVALGALSALWLVRARRTGSARAAWLAALGFGSALLAKEPALALVALLPVVALAAGGARLSLARSLTPCAVVLALWFGVRAFVFGEPSAGLLRSVTDYGLGAGRMAWLRVELVAHAFQAGWWPHDAELLRAVKPRTGFDEPATLGRLAVIGASIAVGLVAWRRGATAVWLGCAWMGLSLLPALANPSAVGRHPLNDRAVYLGGLGGALAVAGVLAGLARVLPRARPAFLLAPAAAIVLAGVRAHERTATWRDDRSLFERALAQNPDSSVATWTLGRLALERYRETGEAAEVRAALARFERAQELALLARAGREQDLVASDDVLQANVGLGWSLLYTSELDGFGDVSDVIALFEQVIGARPDSVQARLGLGAAHFFARDFDAATEATRAAIDRAPDDPRPHADLGRMLYKLGDLDRARRHLERASELRPWSAQDAVWVARVWLDLGRDTRAESQANRARELDPENADALVVLAQVDLARSEAASALEHAERALALAPEDPLVHLARGKALALLGSTEEALLAWRRACEFGPNLFEPHLRVMAALREVGALDASLPYLRRAYELCPEAGLRAQLRGWLASELPDDVDALVALARIDGARGETAAARAWLERALAAEPEALEPLLERARLESAAGRPDLAATDLERARAFAPDRFDVGAELAQVYARMGEEASARAELERVLALLPEEARGGPVEEALRASVESALAARPPGPVAPREPGD